MTKPVSEYIEESLKGIIKQLEENNMKEIALYLKNGWKFKLWHPGPLKK